MICPKCGGMEYWSYRDFPEQRGISKCKKCNVEMVNTPNSTKALKGKTENT